MLGLLAVHLLILAVEEFYDLTAGPRGLVACDNLGGLNKSKQRRRKISPSSKLDECMADYVVQYPTNMSTFIRFDGRHMGTDESSRTLK